MLILMLSVTRFDQEIPEMSSNKLNLAFDGKFNTIDYGSFKVCIGLGDFSSILLYSIRSRGYKICRLNAPNDELATGFLKLLKTKLVWHLFIKLLQLLTQICKYYWFGWFYFLLCMIFNISIFKTYEFRKRWTTPKKTKATKWLSTLWAWLFEKFVKI